MSDHIDPMEKNLGEDIKRSKVPPGGYSFKIFRDHSKPDTLHEGAMSGLTEGDTRMEKKPGDPSDGMGKNPDEDIKRFKAPPGEYEFKIFQNNAGGDILHSGLKNH